jgi:hypothetical protein
METARDGAGDGEERSEYDQAAERVQSLKVQVGLWVIMRAELAADW